MTDHPTPITEAGESFARYLIGLGVSRIYADEAVRGIEEEAAATVERIDPLRLARAIHLISHQYAHLWDVTADCGCILKAAFLATNYAQEEEPDDGLTGEGRADRGDDRSATGTGPVE